MKKNNSAESNFALPGKPLSQFEFVKMIKTAEKGLFHTVQDVKINVEKWKAKYPK